MTIPKVRSDCRYNIEELQKILPFKLDFLAATIAQRMTMLKRHILPALFNYWQEMGKEYDSKESRILSKV
jgi:hypothetical protein